MQKSKNFIHVNTSLFFVSYFRRRFEREKIGACGVLEVWAHSPHTAQPDE